MTIMINNNTENGIYVPGICLSFINVYSSIYYLAYSLHIYILCIYILHLYTFYVIKLLLMIIYIIFQTTFNKTFCRGGN